MAEPRQVVSPKENVAESQVITITTAESKIKELIVKSYYENWPKDVLEKEIAKVVYQVAGNLPERLQNDVKMALAQSAQKWHYTYMNNLKLANIELIKQVITSKSIAVDNKTYSIDLATLAGRPANESKAIIDRFRPLLTQDKIGSQVIADYEKRVKSEIKRLASDTANLSRVDKNGKPYVIYVRNFAEMQVRYEENIKDVARLKDEGVKLVWTSSHADASGRCAPYQGRLYSLDGTSGKTEDGIPYSPLIEAQEGPRGDGNGIINGYNCRHRLIEYQPNSRSPKDYDRDTIRKENAITSRQRSYEREIRYIKTQELLERQAGNKASADKLNNQWHNRLDSYKAFSLSNKRPFYEWRTKVTDSEQNIATLD
jgi:hypothetical protein